MDLCGQPTCMVFDTKIAEGAKEIVDCPFLTTDKKAGLKSIYGTFNLAIFCMVDDFLRDHKH